MVRCYTGRHTGLDTVAPVSRAAMVPMKVSLFIPVHQSLFLPGVDLHMGGRYMKQGYRELVWLFGAPGMVSPIALGEDAAVLQVVAGVRGCLPGIFR